jgi:DnaJ-class molecular chaperone
MALRGKGNKFASRTGDAVLIVEPNGIKNDKYNSYYIDERNVHSSQDVTLETLLFGGKINVECVGGEIKEIDIPKLYDLKNKVKIPEMGVRTSDMLPIPAGDHYVTLQIKYPEIDKLTDEFRQAISAAYQSS